MYTKSLATGVWLLVYAMEALIMIAGVPLYLRPVFSRREVAENAKFSYWLPVISAGLAIGITLIAVFGNGYSEVARHSHLSYFYTSVLFLWIAGYAWVLAGRYFARGNASTKQAESAR